MKFVLAFAITVLFGANLAAQSSIQGEDDAAYVAARDTWLAGEDLPALRALSELSHAGNAAAQILLARIAAKGALHSHVTGQMLRRKRAELLRMPGGLSGKSWLEAAAPSVPLAQAFLDAAQVDRRGAGLDVLLAHGEIGDALIAAQGHVAHGHADAVLAAFIGSGLAIPVEGRYVLRSAIEAAQGQNGGFDLRQIPEIFRARRLSAGARLAWTPLHPATLKQDAEQSAAAIDLLPDLAPYQPLRQFCERHCPGSMRSCVAVVASFSLGPLPYNSPAERLISNELYWSSPRIEQDIRNRVSQSPFIQVLPTMGDVDQCAVDTLLRG